MVDPTTKAVETSRGGKPKDEPPTQLELAFRAQNGSVGDLGEIDKSLGSVLSQLQAVKDQVTDGANATVRRMSRMIGEAMATAKAAQTHTKAVQSDLRGSADTIRQAAIYDAQRTASWQAMEADVREAQENEATHRQVAVNAIAEAQRARAATGRAVVLCSVVGFVTGVAVVVVAFAFYAAGA